jgi:hypothetical protein
VRGILIKFILMMMMIMMMIMILVVMMMIMMMDVDAALISNPSIAPSNMPNLIATYRPTISPVISLTNFPTITSSTFFNIPTMNPSAQPYPILTFKSDFTFENITVATLDTDKVAESTVSETTAASMNISNSCVIYESSSSSSSYYYSSALAFNIDEHHQHLQNKEEDVSGMIQHMSDNEDMDDVSMTSSTDATIYVSDNNRTIIVTTRTQVQVTGSYTSTTLYNSLTDKLTKTVESGQYTMMLHSRAQSYGAMDLYYVNVSKVVNYDEHGIVQIISCC